METNCPLCGSLNHIFDGPGFGRCSGEKCNAIYPLHMPNQGLSRPSKAASGSSGTLLIDFGTSSIRVGLRTTGKPSLLSLASYHTNNYASGEESEIKSWIFIDKRSARVYFGDEAATRASHLRRDGIYFRSPKNWLLKDFASIDSPPSGVTDLAVSKFSLLVGLLAHALKPIESAEGVLFSGLEIRLAHPVFEEPNWSQQKLLFEQLLAAACSLCCADEPTQGIELSALPTRGPLPPAYSYVDISEPVAAAVHQFENSNNSRELCAIVDVGAGTTDLGLFVSLTPDYSLDNSGRFPRRFKSIAPAVSIPYAGDFIDDLIIELFSDKLEAWILDRLRLEVREEKAKIFNTGKTIYHDCTISEQDLLEHPKITSFTNKIYEVFTKMIASAQVELESLCTLRIHAITHVNVVFVGGGANLPFIRSAIPDRITINNNFALPVIKHGGCDSSQAVGQRVPSDRFSVVFGGLTAWQDWPMDNASTALVGGLDRMPMKGVITLGNFGD